MTEEKYFEKDFRWERGFYRAPDGVLLAIGFLKYYKIPPEDEKRARRAHNIYWLIVYILVAAVLIGGAIGGLPVSIVGTLAVLAICFIFFGIMYINRNWKAVSVINASFKESIYLEAQKNSFWAYFWLAILLLLFSIISVLRLEIIDFFITFFALMYMIVLAITRWKQNSDAQKNIE